jgi:hypothetical protein
MGLMRKVPPRWNGRTIRLWQSRQRAPGGSVKRSLAMAVSKASRLRIAGRMPATRSTIAKTFGLDAVTQFDCYFFVVDPPEILRIFY